MPINDLERFLNTWDREAEKTMKLLRALPASQYDFRPDQGGRSLGELAWHLAEGDAYMSFGIEKGQFAMDMKPRTSSAHAKWKHSRPDMTAFIRKPSLGSESSRPRTWTGPFLFLASPCPSATSSGK
jgi:uncharacterized damage-inducible protein DinB